MLKTLPYGSWPSPLSARVATQLTDAYSDVQVDRTSPINPVYHLEYRPDEDGRSVIVHTASKSDLVPADWNITSRVHEYGGGSWKMDKGRAIFTTFNGGVFEVFRLAVVKGKEHWSHPHTILEANDVHRFADFDVHPFYKHLILAILEDHTIPTPSSEVVNSLVLINTLTRSFTTIASGRDFYTYPRWSPDGRFVAYVSWNFPDMPFEGSELFIGQVSLSPLGYSFWKEEPVKVAGMLGDVESVTQPVWLPKSHTETNKLVFATDRSGYNNFYFWNEYTGIVERVAKEAYEHDFCGPPWRIGMSNFAPLDNDTFLATWGPTFYVFSLSERKIDSGFTTSTPFISGFPTICSISKKEIAFIVSSKITPTYIGTLDFGSGESEKPIQEFDMEVLTDVVTVIDPTFVSIGQDVEFDTEDDGLAGGKVVKGHGIYYPPCSATYIGPDDEKPPLIIHSHGGPTSSAGRGFSAQFIQYFTTRGFAMFDLDYGGSTSYGKVYRRRLKGKWGVVDVRDAQNSVIHLSRAGLIDSDRVGIVGGSAGGFLVLACLATGWAGWGVGVSYFGVSDLKMLAKDTHKFESRYLERLMGGTLDEVKRVWEERSPINNADKIVAPLLLLQGLEDKVVPPPQAIKMKESLEERHVKVKLVLYEGEGHGFRMAKNIISSKKEEVKFYRETWGIESEEELSVFKKVARGLQLPLCC